MLPAELPARLMAMVKQMVPVQIRREQLVTPPEILEQMLAAMLAETRTLTLVRTAARRLCAKPYVERKNRIK